MHFVLQRNWSGIRDHILKQDDAFCKDLLIYFRDRERERERKRALRGKGRGRGGREADFWLGADQRTSEITT